MKRDKKYVAFRVDVSSQIGTGHFMRCLTLALQLKNLNVKVVFICRHITATHTQILHENEISLRLLEHSDIQADVDELAHSHWLGVSQAQDAKSSIKALSDRKWDWLIVDHYALDARWEKLLQNSTVKIMVIDDLADRNHDCDLLVDQNFYLDMDKRYLAKASKNCRLLLGPKYALLRPQFLEARDNLRLRNDIVERVLVFFGGVDSENFTSKAITAISKTANYNLKVDVVIGKEHPQKSKIIKDCNKWGYSCHIQVENMASLIANADVAIGAGGTATWERCALGLPSVTIAVAENQQKLTQDAALAGFIYKLETGSSEVEKIQLHFSALVENPSLRRAISDKGKQLVDAKGACRIASIMLPHEVILHEAKERDMKALYDWRNHPSIREVSRNTSIIKWDDHQKWFLSVLSRDDVKLLVGRLNNQDIGIIRFDFEDYKAEISIYLAPDLQSSGIGSALLKAAENWLISVHPEINQIDAEVMENNCRSKRFFTNNGYTCASSMYYKRITS